MGELKEAGCVAVSDDGRPVMNAELMRRALEYARTFGLTDRPARRGPDAVGRGGAMNEGAVSTRAGIRAQPASAESAMVARDIELCALTGARYHVAHVSSADSVRAGARGQAARPAGHLRGDAAPPDADRRGVRRLRHATKCNPPLRTGGRRRGAARGAGRRHHRRVATDHAPHSPVEKDVEFEQAAFGMIGLETALPLMLELVRAGRADAARRWSTRMSAAPAAVFGLPGGTLADGAPADVTVIDPEPDWTVRRGGAAVARRATRRSRGGRCAAGRC